MDSSQKPDVFRYRDYRTFLGDLYKYKKTTEYGFSYRRFAKKAGFRSPNYLKLVIENKRKLTPKMAIRFASTCELIGAAADYFVTLVGFNQATTAEERETYYNQLRSFKPYKKVFKLDEAHTAYHSQWYIPAIRELVPHPSFREDPAWIARTLLPSISSKEAEEALLVLRKLDMIKTDKYGKTKQTTPLVGTSDQPLGHHIKEYHKCMMQRATAAMDLIPRDERNISSVTVCVSESNIKTLYQLIENFRKQVLQIAALDESPMRVLQLNLQMFPLTVEIKDESAP